MFTTFFGSADVLGYEVSPANSLQWNGQTCSTYSVVSGRAMELVSGHEPFLELSNRGALPSLTPA